MTYQELQEYVRERLGIPTGDSSRVTLVQRTINAEYMAAAVRSEATLQSQALTLTNNVATVNMSAGVEKVKAILRGSPAGRLTPVSVSRFTFLAGTYTAASEKPAAPAYYVVLLSGAVVQVRVWPTPTVTDSGATAFVVVKPTALSVNGDVPSSVPEEFHHSVIGERAVQRVALAEQEIALAGTAGALADEGFLALAQHVRDRNGELDSVIESAGDVGLTPAQMMGQGR